MSRAQLTSTVEQNSAGAAAPWVGSKNAIINGGMDWWQRSTSFSVSAYAYSYLADRWYTFAGTNNATFSQQASTQTGFSYALQVQRNSGQTGTFPIKVGMSLETRESLRFAGQNVTLSFYAKAGANFSAASSLLAASINSGTGTDQNLQNGGFTNNNYANGSFTLTSSFQRFTLTYAVPSNATQLGIEFDLNGTGTAGANDWFQITGVQLEVGSVATPFSRAGGTLQGELALCQRYYWRSTAGYAYSFLTPFCGSAGNSTTVAYFAIPVPVPLRISTPSAVDYSNIAGSDGANLYTGTWAVGTSSTGTPLLSLTTTGLVNYRPLSIQANNSSSAYVGFSAEL